MSSAEGREDEAMNRRRKKTIYKELDRAALNGEDAPEGSLAAESLRLKREIVALRESILAELPSPLSSLLRRSTDAH